MTTKPCPECEGQGQREFERYCRASASNPYGDIESYMAECDNCSGSGEIDDDAEDDEHLLGLRLEMRRAGRVGLVGVYFRANRSDGGRGEQVVAGEQPQERHAAGEAAGRTEKIAAV